MDICKNADEYLHELSRLHAKGWREFHPKMIKLIDTVRSIENPTKQDWQNRYKAERILWENCFKESIDFENKHPIKPLFIFKKGRKYYQLKFIDEQPYLSISDKPIDMQLLNAKKSEWVKEITFPGCAVDVLVCPHCKNKFVRYKPHQKYCPMCKMGADDFVFHPLIDFDKHRYCQNCGKHLPITKHGKAKYCCGACRTAAYEKRKNLS